MKRFVLLVYIIILPMIKIAAMENENQGFHAELLLVAESTKVVQPLAFQALTVILKNDKNQLVDFLPKEGFYPDLYEKNYLNQIQVQEGSKIKDAEGAGKLVEVNSESQEIKILLVDIMSNIDEKLVNNLNNSVEISTDANLEILNDYWKEVKFPGSYFEKLKIKKALEQVNISSEKTGWVKEKAAGIDVLLKYKNSRYLQEYLKENSLSFLNFPFVQTVPVV